jgi:hypothetical protein
VPSTGGSSSTSPGRQSVASSAEWDAIRDLGALLTGTEARLVAGSIADEESVSSAFSVVDSTRRHRAIDLVSTAGLRARRDELLAILRAIEGARSHVNRVETVWTMPGHLAGGGALTSSLVRLVDGARSSVVCSAFNLQKSSGMWTALRRAASRPRLRGLRRRTARQPEYGAGRQGPGPARRSGVPGRIQCPP